MAVRIDMDMPKDCTECWFNAELFKPEPFHCGCRALMAWPSVVDYSKGRPSNCPLKECK